MCGICGVYRPHGGGDECRALAARLVAGLAHRGPDGSGLRHEAGSGAAVWLGHARLAIIGVADGAQPLANEDGSLLLVVNGEIYNHRELRRDLEARGHRFATASDCEVLLHLYEERGRALLDPVRGMYAFALWDARAGGLLLGRDRIGKKPLYYRATPNEVAFASELTPLLDAGGALRADDVDPVALREILGLRYASAPSTIARAVRQLPPAHLAWCDARGVALARYWSSEPVLGPPPSRYEARRAVRRALDSAVAVRLESEVPLGAFLSGGIDSTLVVAAMARAAQRPVSTFAIGFTGAPDLDERAHARFVAEWLGCEHHEEVVTPDATEVAPRLVEHFGEPFADSSALPCWYLARMARRHVTVALSGDGGDELFAGYRRHLAARAAALVARVPGAVGVVGAIGAALRLVPRREARRRSAQLARFAERVALPPLARYAAWVALFDAQERAALLAPRWVGPDDELERRLGEALVRDPALLVHDPVAAVGRVDLGTYLPGDLLVKVDRTSMAHALEVRCPFLDHHVVELAQRLPGSWRLPRWHLKGLLKRACADDLPLRIATRRKQGFAVPLAEWLRGPLDRWLRELVTDPAARLAAFCRREAVVRLVDEHARGAADHGERLWSLAILELWSRRFLAPGAP